MSAKTTCGSSLIVMISARRTAAYVFCIVWREHSTDELSVYKLNTLTHGTRTAAFLAIRVMHQLSYAEEESFPFGAKTV